MNLIDKAVIDIRNEIPTEILRMAYLEERYNQLRRPISLDEAIRDRTVIGRVVMDTNLLHGVTDIINLEGIQPVMVDGHNFLFEIPDERTGGRKILSVYSVGFFRSDLLTGYQYASVPQTAPMIGTELSASAHRAMDSRGSIPMISTSEVIVVGHNVVMVRNHLSAIRFAEMRCCLEHDANLQNLPMTVFPSFSKLCTLAAKSFIYKELDIRLDRGAIDRGHEIGRIRARVDEYADAEQSYQEFRDEEWGRVLVMSDRLTAEDLLKMQLDPGI